MVSTSIRLFSKLSIHLSFMKMFMPFEQRRPRAKEPESQILVCHCHQVSCFLQENALNCPIQCKKDTGERYEIVDSVIGGGRICTCPLCSCMCQAVYKKEAITDIKLAQRLVNRPITNQTYVVTPHESKLQASTAVVQNMLKRNLEAAGHPSNAKNLFQIKSRVSMVEEFAYNDAATMLAPSLHQHPELIQEFRSDTQDQMKPGVRTIIMIDGKKKDVRALHNGNLWHHREANNNLNPEIVDNINKSTVTVDLSLDEHGKAKSTAQHGVNNPIGKSIARNLDNSHFECADVVHGNTSFNGDATSVRKAFTTKCAPSEIINVDESNETASFYMSQYEAGDVYAQIVEYCFTQDHEYASDTDRLAFRDLYSHLTKQRLGCESCRYTCNLMIKQGTRQLDVIVKRLLLLLDHHDR